MCRVIQEAGTPRHEYIDRKKENAIYHAFIAMAGAFVENSPTPTLLSFPFRKTYITLIDVIVSKTKKLLA